MRKIALTQRVEENKAYGEIKESLDTNYPKLVSLCGFLPIVMPYDVGFERYFNEFHIDGVILTGGNDLNSCCNSELSQKRDAYEKKLLGYCIEKEIPVFGICRGMQLIAEFFGSTLMPVDGQVNIKHKLKVNGDSKYAFNLNKIEQVNSYHNFGIDILSDELLVSAINDNGVIKAIEHKKFKIFAQMWHSEREHPLDINQIVLMQEFFND